jgi:hypothetical protein
MRLRFTIRDLLWLAVVVALAVGWCGDHQKSIKKWSELHYWFDFSTNQVHFSRGDKVDGAHMIQGTVRFPEA